MDWGVIYHPAYWQGKQLNYPNVPKEHPKFSQSVVVGNLVLVSGCGGKDTVSGAAAPAGVADQVNVALDKTRAALETAGSAMENIVKTFFLVKSLDDYAEVRKTETEYYEKHAPSLVETPPAATLMVVPGLANPDYQLEYEAIGVIDRKAADWDVTYYPEYWGGRELAFPHVPREHAKFARTQVAGKLVIVSGCQALDHDTVKVESMDFAKQTRICLEKIRIGMEETGGSLDTVAKTIVFIKDENMLPLYREVEQAYYREHSGELADAPPASTVIIVKELPRPEFLVEVEAYGVAGPSSPDWTMQKFAAGDRSTAAASAGNLLYISGCDASGPGTGEAPDDVEQQIIAALDKVRSATEAAGSSMDNVIKTLMMLKHLEDYPKMRKAETEYYEKHAPQLVVNPPASTFIQLPAITTPGSLFQIDATAVL